MSNYAKTLAGVGPKTSETPQTEAILGREADMAKNNAGGFSFVLNEWDQLDRFLILGTEGGTYYASEQKLTKENAQLVLKLIREDGSRVVNRVVEISDSGRAPKNDPALFVLALASAADKESTRQEALAALPKVARIGTHLYHFAAFVEGFRGWGRALRRAIANWYLDMPVDRLANQAIKFQSRDGWSHRDMLRLGHPKTDDPARDAILKWMTKGDASIPGLHPQIQAFEAAKRATAAKDIVKLIIDHDLPREAIPTQFLTDASVWEALLEKMPMTAMIRNLATMTRVGLLTPMSAAEQKVKAQLLNADALRKARVHPIQVLAAHMTYSAGRGARGQNTWTPSRAIVDATDDAFYLSFGNVTPTNKATLLALDVSGSMTGGEIAGVPGLSPRVASAAMALITANVEPNYQVIGFTGGRGSSYGGWGGTTNRKGVHASGPVSILDISPKMRIKDVCDLVNGLPFGTTDCALPVTWAQGQKLPVENFSVYTDSETYAGSIHPSQALKSYRQKTGLQAKLAVVGMTSTGFTIADPKDAGMMDFVGFDTAAPQLMSDFFSR